MPVYTYRREDGTTFDFRQKFTDDPLSVDPTTGQKVTRIVQATSVIFKGSGFYVNDSKGKSSTVTPASKSESSSESKSSDSAAKPEAKSDSTSTKAEKVTSPAAD